MNDSVSTNDKRPRWIRSRKLLDTHFDEHEVPYVTNGIWDYADLTSSEHSNWFHQWISFDCLLADDQRQIIWCGLTRLDTDVFWAYDRRLGQFRSMGFSKVANRFDAKFHRSLVFDDSGNIWAATALLHEIDLYDAAPGGAIVRFDPNMEQLTIQGRPMPNLYIQSLQIDRRRGILFGQTYTPEMFFSYDLERGECRLLGPLGSGVSMGQSEQLAIDRYGAVWGCCALGRPWAYTRGLREYRIWRYHPDEKQRRIFTYGLPSLNNHNSTVKADGACMGPDGAVYMGTTEGTLCRIDPDSFKIDLIGKPTPGRRLAGMAVGPDGRLYGSCGRDGSANLFCYDPTDSKLINLGPIYDPECGQQAWQIHDMTITADGVIYAGENDVPYRSGYLWEIHGYILP